MGKNKVDISLYLVTDRLDYSMEVFLNKIKEAIEGGVTLVQLREKNVTTKEYIELGKKVKALTDKLNIPLIIDDRIDVCLAINASGVHLGSEDMDIEDARKILGKDYIIGATAKTLDRAKECEKQGADYLGCGAVYPTTTKVKTVLTPVDTIRKIKESVNIPVGAIGGLNKNNMEVLRGSKVDGICVVSALMKAENPKVEAKILKEIFEKL